MLQMSIVESKENFTDVRTVMEGWTTQPGYPVVQVLLVTPKSGQLLLTVSQAPFELDKGQFSHRTWHIPVTMYTSTNVQWDTANLQWLTTNQSSFVLDSFSRIFHYKIHQVFHIAAFK